MLVTESMTLQQVIQQAGLQHYSYAINHMERLQPSYASDTLQKIFDDCPGWNRHSILQGLQYLCDRAEQGQVFYELPDSVPDSQGHVMTVAAFPVQSATAEKPSKFVLICPGGGYQNVCPMCEGFPLAKKLNSLGYAAFVLHYRTMEDAASLHPVQDLASGLKFVLSHAADFKVEAKDFAVMGFSAGGHLAATCGTDNLGFAAHGLPAPSVLILGYPVITLGKHTHEGSAINFLGCHYRDPAAKAQCSVENHVGPDFPPTFVWQYAADDTVPSENTMMLVDALRVQQVPFCCEMITGTAHGVGLADGTAAEGWVERALDFWRRRSLNPGK